MGNTIKKCVNAIFPNKDNPKREIPTADEEKTSNTEESSVYPNSEEESCESLTTESVISQNPEPSIQSPEGDNQSTGLNDTQDDWSEVRGHPLIVRAKEFEKNNEETTKDVNDGERYNLNSESKSNDVLPNGSAISQTQVPTKEENENNYTCTTYEKWDPSVENIHSTLDLRDPKYNTNSAHANVGPEHDKYESIPDNERILPYETHSPLAWKMDRLYYPKNHPMNKYNNYNSSKQPSNISQENDYKSVRNSYVNDVYGDNSRLTPQKRCNQFRHYRSHTKFNEDRPKLFNQSTFTEKGTTRNDAVNPRSRQYLNRDFPYYRHMNDLHGGDVNRNPIKEWSVIQNINAESNNHPDAFNPTGKRFSRYNRSETKKYRYNNYYDEIPPEL